MPYAQSLIDAFSEMEKPPHIAVSVDMMDTGIDVPEMVNLVFFKIVRSKTKFIQMISRGTRTCKDLFGPSRDKESFRIFDFCQNFQFFGQNPEVREGAVGVSLGERLFAARVEVVGALDAFPGDEQAAALRNSIAGRLHEKVDGMNLDNFIVRPKRRSVERFKEGAAWAKLSEADRQELIEEVAGLPSAFVDDDHGAKQFDLLVLRTRLALLAGDAAVLSTNEKRIRHLASDLETLENVPLVKRQMELILEVQTDEFWADITAPLLETMRKRLRDLIKLIEPQARNIVISDFEDEIGDGIAAPFDRGAIGTDMSRFRRKVRRFLEDHQDHIAFQKIRRAERLTEQDVAELERMFTDEGVADTDQLAAIRSDGGLGTFLRSLLGLDRQAAKQAFDEVLDPSVMTANQIEFIDLIIDHLTERGVIDPGLLYESPFTDKNDQGLTGVFLMDQSQQVIAVIDRLNRSAAA